MTMRPTLLVLLLLAAATTATGALQMEEEDISFQQGAALRDLEQRFEEAMAVFRSVDQPDSIPMFGDLIGELSAAPAEDADGPARRDLLDRALLRRAEAQFNLGLRDEAAADLRRAVEIDPDLQIDVAEISPKLAELFRTVRDETVGTIAVTATPVDATVRVDGTVRAAKDGVVPVLAGAHALTIERPGFDFFQTELDVPAGKSVPVKVELARTSAVIKVATRLPGATVLVDGQSRGVTAPVEPENLATEEAAPAGDTEEPPPVEDERREPPAVLLVDGLLPGDHVLEIQREGYRPYRAEVSVADLVDYEIAPVELIETRGMLVLSALPEGTAVSIDGEAPAAAPVDGGLTLDLSVGRHELVVDSGTVGAWTTTFELADQETVELEAELHPRVAVLGVLGGDSAAASRLLDDLRGTLGESGRWQVEDHSDAAPAALATLGLDASRLRGERGEAVEWERVQELVDRRYPASVYVLAVLSDDLFASSADLFFWPAAPSPAGAETVTVPLGPPSELDRVREAFDFVPEWSRPSLGGRWMVSPVDDLPVVVEVIEGGPFATAGLQPGDRVVSLEGRPTDELGRLPAGSRTPCVIERGGTEVPTTLAPAQSPSVFVAGHEDVPAAVLAAWVTLGEALDHPPAWLVALNRAAVAVRVDAWESVVRTLRGVEAPLGPGLGQAMVDYWLGTALLATDPASYLSQARSMLERAAAVDGGRLLSDDGPLVAPRARARLEALSTP
ncbi:MAG: PEGA domain-containing protein [Thermoanaerobaculia bacterium]